MNNLQRRLERIEEMKGPAEDGKINVRYAHLRALPRDYVGEKHTVLTRGWPSETPDGDCELEERPGRGPELDFGFNERTILVRYVSVGEAENRVKEGGKAL
jgi:hypothetical protein